MSGMMVNYICGQISPDSSVQYIQIKTPLTKCIVLNAVRL